MDKREADKMTSAINRLALAVEHHNKLQIEIARISLAREDAIKHEQHIDIPKSDGNI